MAKKLIVVAHGIGDADEDFADAWAEEIAKHHDLKDVEVKGLWWTDLRKRVEEKYPVVSGEMAEILALCNFPDLSGILDGAAFKKINGYVMDVLVYVGLPDMWLYIQDACARKLDELRRDSDGKEVFEEADTILVGHSLGAAMLPQLVWREYCSTGTVPYRGLILLASPLGFASPAPGVCKDFLQRMGELRGGSREGVLKRFARAWNMSGPGTLRFVSNAYDIVCSDVEYAHPLTGEAFDPLPLRQGFSQAEIGLLEAEHPGCVKGVSFGEPVPGKIAGNHDVFAYLKQDAFNEALAGLLR